MKNLATKIIISIMVVVSAFMVMGVEAKASTITDSGIVMCDGDSISGKGMSDIIDAHKEFKGLQEQNNKTSVDAFIGNLIGIGQVLVIIGGATLLVVGGIMAIKWITATPDKQAKLKTQSIGLVLAAVVIFGAVGIWNFVRSIMGDVEDRVEQTQNNKEIVYYINA